MAAVIPHRHPPHGPRHAEVLGQDGDMPIDLAAAGAFMAGHARLLDRRRFDLLLGRAAPATVLAALEAYRNPDGGYGYGLEPDLRAPESQPITALHAFEAMEECAPSTTRTAVELCDWLASVSHDDGGLPFVLPIADPTACAPWFAGADATEASLHGTLAVASAAWRVGHHDSAVSAHPWLARATRFCLDRLAEDAERLHAYEVKFALNLLDALPDPPADLIASLVATLSPAGTRAVEGGIEGEQLRPLDFAPHPQSAVRAHLSVEAVEADLARLESGQQEDGGWTVDFASFSPAAALEWRGVATVHAVAVLARNGRLS